MKVLRDVDQVLHIMDAKLDELHKKFDEAGEKEAAEIGGQEVAIIRIARHIRHAIEDHGYFGHDYLGVRDMVCVYEYVADARGKFREYGNPIDTCFMKGRAEGATWAMKEIEKRMEREP